MTSPHLFGVYDWIVLVAYAATLLGIGYHFSRQQRTTEEYFVGNRSVRPFIAGISLFTAISSIISYIATPGEYIQFGPVLAFAAMLLALPFSQFIIGRWFIPVIMRLPITSAYELLQARLGLSVRRTGSLTYIITRFVWMSLILCVSSRVLVTVIGCDQRWGYVMAVVIGLVTTTYTLIGGIRTVMITEVMQFFIMVLGILLTLTIVTVKVGGISAWWPHHWERHWPSQPFFSLDPRVRVSFIAAFIYNIAAMVTQSGADQSTIQRFLTTPDVKTARRAYRLTNIVIGASTLMLGLVGAALLAFYRLNPGVIPNHYTFAANGDAFFPLFITQFLPTGISGLVVASLMSMAMSCLSAGISAVIIIITKDFIETSRNKRERTEAEKMRIARWLALAIGVSVIFGSVAMRLVRGNVMEVTTKTVGLLGSPLFGLFFLAIFVKFATPFGAIMSAVISTVCALVVGYWDVFTGQPPISFLWITPVSLVVSMASGCLLSLLPTRGRSGAAIAAYTAAILVPLFAAVGWLIASNRLP